MSEQIRTRGPLRHACQLCSGSCQGVHVRLVGPDAERVTKLAAKLDVSDPLVEGKLRFSGGRCVFLGTDGLCRLHAQFGAEAKPKVCQQYPIVATRTESGEVRVGIDPGCYTSSSTWRDGPEVAEESLVVTKMVLPPDQAAIEARLLQLMELPGLTIPHLAAALTGMRPTPGALPRGYAARWASRLVAADIPGLLTSSDTAPKMRSAFAPLLELLTWLEADTPPTEWTLPADVDAYAVDAIARLVHLRLLASIPTLQGAALLAVGGAVAIGWSTPDPSAFGAAFASWCRALRSQLFWTALTPDAETMRWLALGDPS